MSSELFLPTLPSLLSSPGQPFIHRDLSWLLFNDRVLAEARTSGNPLLERVKFLAITASNLDEFFMIRFASLSRSVSSSKTHPDRLEHLIRIRDAILERVAQFSAKQSETLDLLSSELENLGIRVVRSAKAGDPAFDLGKKVFEEQVLPHLPPPEGFVLSKLGDVENLKTGVFFKNEIWFRVSRKLPAMYCAQAHWSTEMCFFFLDDLISQHLGASFRLEGQPGFLRFTRDGDIDVDLETDGVLTVQELVRLGLGSRELGRPVRLQYMGELPEGLLEYCAKQFKLTHGQIIPAPSTLYLHGLWTVFRQASEFLPENPSIRHPASKPIVQKRFTQGQAIFDGIKEQDFLLHHPYDSFEAYVNWIRAACEDPKVIEIQQTIYRMDATSPVVELLKTAAKTKKVRVIIELRARFDELNNLHLAEELRAAGVTVAFGFGTLKLHAKVALVTREEEGGLRYYTHLSTGNYNSATARLYEDLAILTANTDLGQDAKHFFDAVAKGEIPTEFKYLVPAPTDLHRRLVNLIQAEVAAARKGLPARIVAKVNALVDEAIIKHLYKASQSGVQVDLIVRGACSLIPGVKGLSENIRVISVIDRYLEHSRLYYFAHSQAMYLSSADWMPRNFFSRLELAFPVLDPGLYKYIVDAVIPAYLADSVKARELTPQGLWKKRTMTSVKAQYKIKELPVLHGKAIRSQLFFEEMALKAYQGTSLEFRA